VNGIRGIGYAYSLGSDNTFWGGRSAGIVFISGSAGRPYPAKRLGLLWHIPTGQGTLYFPWRFGGFNPSISGEVALAIGVGEDFAQEVRNPVAHIPADAGFVLADFEEEAVKRFIGNICREVAVLNGG
jgi:hypothetical protein